MRELQLFPGTGYMQNFDGENRFDFPGGIIRVTAGAGGEAILVIGSEKCALVDCGMAYCGAGVVKNIQIVLDDLNEASGTKRSLDYILLSHTHYDHIGALSILKKNWPNAVVCAGEYAAYVLQRKGALNLMRTLSEKIALQYTGSKEVELDPAFMKVDCVLHENDRISLGEEYFTVLETPGHTNCSVTYILEPAKIMFTSESCGNVLGPGRVECQALKSYAQARASIDKCRAYGAGRIIIPHYGIIPAWYHDTFWELSKKNLDAKASFARERIGQMPEEEIVQDYIRAEWTDDRNEEQPYPAFCENAVHVIHAALLDVKGES